MDTAAGADRTGRAGKVPEYRAETASSAEGTPEFVACGHAVQDLIDGSGEDWRLGGAVAYASLLATQLGLRAAILTSTGPEMELGPALPGVEVVRVLANESTQMRNVYDGGRRRQEMPRRAAQIGAGDVPETWRGAPIVLLGPVTGEIDDSLAACFEDALIGAGAQGWLRETGTDASVHPISPDAWRAEPVLSRVRALFLSDEDLPPESAERALGRWSTSVETLAFTRGDNGADICHRGVWKHIDAFPATAVDRTGAGDVFAAAFLIRFHETNDAWEAARFAGCAASFAVEGEGVSSIPDRAMIHARLSANPEITPR